MDELNLDDLLAIQLALNAEIDGQQFVLDEARMFDHLDDAYNLALKRKANAESALNKVMAMVDSAMDGGDKGPAVGAVITTRLLDVGKVEIELSQAEHQYTDEALTVARLALDDVLAHLVTSLGGGKWVVDWPNL